MKETEIIIKVRLDSNNIPEEFTGLLLMVV